MDIGIEKFINTCISSLYVPVHVNYSLHVLINKWWIDDICLIYIVLTITSWNNSPWIENVCENNTCTCSKTRGWDFQRMKFEFASVSLCTQNKFFAHLSFPDHLLPDISTL